MNQKFWDFAEVEEYPRPLNPLHMQKGVKCLFNIMNNERRHTLAILQAGFQTTTIKQIPHTKKGSHQFVGFPVYIKVMFTLYGGLLVDNIIV